MIHLIPTERRFADPPPTGDPITLTADFLTVVAGSTVRMTDFTSLKNPWNEDMMIEGVRISLKGSGAVVTAGGMKFKFILDSSPLTNEFIPLPLLCRRLPDEDFSGLANQMFIWKFPKPLYVPKGSFIAPSIQAASFNSISPSTSVTYWGWSIPKGTPPPVTVDIPYATAFVGDRKTIASGDTTEETNDQDIRNPFNEPLSVDRFLGCVPLDSNDIDIFGAVSHNIGTKEVFVQVTDWMAREVVMDRTPFWALFSPLDRAWNAKCTLPPHGYFHFFFDEKYSLETGLVNAQLGVSMHGSRKVRI